VKSILLIVTLAMVPALVGLQAQTTFDEPSAESVLQTARDMFNQSAGNAGGTEDGTGTGMSFPDGSGAATPEASQPLSELSAAVPLTGPARAEYPYTPMVIGFAPMLNFPFGFYSTSLALAPIGSSVGDLNGLQAAGIFSTVDGRMLGGQFSGIFNLASDGVEGLQAAGIFNVADSSVHGGQVAGIFNSATGAVEGAQVAGIFNSAASHVNGLQVAGIFNTNDSFDGVMVASIINATRQGRGVMVGLVNVADEFDGLALGLVNIIGNGVHDIALDYQFGSQMLYTTLRSGTAFLYASVSAGETVAQLFTADDLTRSVGISLGHRLKVLFMTIDAEVGYELMNNLAGVDDFLAFMAFGNSEELATGAVQGFGSVRFSFNLGRPRHAGLSFGIKVDFGDAAWLNVPSHLRYSFFESSSGGSEFFGRVLPFWPKLFLGLRF